MKNPEYREMMQKFMKKLMSGEKKIEPRPQPKPQVRPMNKYAEKLKKMFISLGRKIGMKVKIIICNGNEPVGNGIGPILEAKDVLWILKNDEKGPVDLKNKSLMIAGDLIDFVSGGKTGRKKAKEILESGKAYKAIRLTLYSTARQITQPGKLSLKSQFAKSHRVQISHSNPDTLF